MNPFNKNNSELFELIQVWESKLLGLSKEIVSNKRNIQNRSIKQILGHLVDSASNNTHRIIHLQYHQSPMNFPNYASYGNNDKWIAIQNYQSEDWQNLIQMWKYSNLHLIHVINNVNMEKLDNEWIADVNKKISLKEMILYYMDHFRLHLNEMDELINQ
jgi:hypothetical protein